MKTKLIIATLVATTILSGCLGLPKDTGCYAIAGSDGKMSSNPVREDLQSVYTRNIYVLLDTNKQKMYKRIGVPTLCDAVARDETFNPSTYECTVENEKFIIAPKYEAIARYTTSETSPYWINTWWETLKVTEVDCPTH